MVEREGMGVMDLEKPFSLASLDSVGESARLIHGRSWTVRGVGDPKRKAQDGKEVPMGTSTYFLTRRVCLASCDGDDRRVRWEGG